MGQRIAIDTPIIIYLLERHTEHFNSAFKLFQDIENGVYTCTFSTIGMIELLTGPKRKNRADLAVSYKEKLASMQNFYIQNITEKIIDITSDLRVKYNLHTPDSIHLATAISTNATMFITNDKALKKVKEIRVELL